MSDKKNYVQVPFKVNGRIRNYTEDNKDIFKIPLHGNEYFYEIEKEKLKEEQEIREKIKEYKINNPNQVQKRVNNLIKDFKDSK